MFIISYVYYIEMHNEKFVISRKVSQESLKEYGVEKESDKMK